MSLLDRLPAELLIYIAEICTWGCETAYPHWFKVRVICGGSRREKRMVAVYYGRSHAALVRVSRRLYAILNGPLYTRNLLRDPPLNSCLLWAAKRGRLETIQVALRFGADLNKVYSLDIPEEVVPLHVALAARNSHVVEFMLKHGVNVHLPSSRPRNCLVRFDGADAHSEITGKRFRSVRKALKLKGIAYPLHTALERGSIEDAASLIEHGAYMIAEDESVLRALDGRGRPDLVEKILQRSDAVTLRARLHHAASSHDLDLVQDILNCLVDAGARDWNKRNALHLAILSGSDDDLRLVELLLRQPGIDATAPDEDGYTPMLTATDIGHINTLKRLLQEPEVVISDRTSKGRTALHLAVVANDRVLVQYLLDQPGIDLTALDSKGHSAISLASVYEQEEESLSMIKLLIASGVTVDNLYSPGRILIEVMELHHMRTALLLVQSGLITSPVALERPYNGGHPILHVCLERPYQVQTELLQELIALGVDVNQVAGERTYIREEHRSFRASPLFVAAAGAGSLECMKLLADAGARVYDGDANWSSILLRLFVHVWGEEPPLDDPAIGEIKDRICFLLQLGATIGRSTTEPVNSALGYACEASTNESCQLLALLLGNSTAANVDQKLVQSLISHYTYDDTGKEARSREIVRRLTKFDRKIFPIETRPISTNTEE